MGKTLDLETLLGAYAQGYFPMPEAADDEIYWYSPDPRAIIPLEKFHASRSLIRSIRKQQFTFSVDKAFGEVMKGCADREETWINTEFKRAYGALHEERYAHSVEVWQGDRLVGGTYGISIGGAFFAESKFHRVTDASKAALYHLVRHLRERGFYLLEVQFLTPHLESLGATTMPASRYKNLLRRAVAAPTSF